MVNILEKAKLELQDIIKNALGVAISAGDLPKEPISAFNVEIPADTKNGDFASNVAMVSARAFKMAPIKIAEAIKTHLVLESTYFERCEIAPPGFMNFFVSKKWFSDAVNAINENADSYGRSNFGQGKKVMVEFVSANPTGPMHIGNARGGAIGDCLASILDCAGYDVTKEFYVNDAGNQIEKFGLSLSVRYLQLFKGEENVPLPEDAYHGADIITHAENFAEIYGDKYVNVSDEERKKALVDYALPLNISALKEDLLKYRINYDVWFLESQLHKNGDVQKCIDILKDKGLTYELDGALFYKASQFGAEKDEVLVRANGIPTYFAADIAYHYNKFATRGFDKVINIWGADHHGHVARLKGAIDAIGLDGTKLDIVLMQLVRLMRNGEPVRVSKRTGKSITLKDLLDEIPIDAARFFFNLREASSQMDFDLDLAVEESSQNPVYYVQYAHARICSIIDNLKKEGIASDYKNCDYSLLNKDEEKELIRYLALLPNEIIDSAKAYDPARITRYSINLATLFHKFYSACRVKGEERSLAVARLGLCNAVRCVLKNVLELLKIEHPDKM